MPKRAWNDALLQLDLDDIDNYSSEAKPNLDMPENNMGQGAINVLSLPLTSQVTLPSGTP